MLLREQCKSSILWRIVPSHFEIFCKDDKHGGGGGGPVTLEAEKGCMWVGAAPAQGGVL